MSEILSNYNYVKNPKSKTDNNIPVPKSSPGSSDSTSNSIETTNLDNSSKNTILADRTDTNNTINNNKGNEITSYTSDFKKILETIKKNEEILKFNKMIKFFKNIANLTKNCTNPIDKMYIIIQKFDSLASEFNFSDDE